MSHLVPGVSRWTPAAAGFGLYFVAAGVFGEVYPFSRFPMYADRVDRGAVPFVLVDGEVVPVERLVDLHGCAPDAVRIPQGVPGRMGWRQDETQRWLASHAATTPGPLEVAYGYAMVEAAPEGPRLAMGQAVILCRGTGRWAP